MEQFSEALERFYLFEFGCTPTAEAACNCTRQSVNKVSSAGLMRRRSFTCSCKMFS